LAGQKKLRELYEQWIGDAEKKLEGLNSNVNPDSPFSRVLADLLEKLKRKEVQKVVLMFDSELDLGIIITSGRKLYLRIPKIKTLRNRNVIGNHQISLLQRMGFQWDARETLLYLGLELNTLANQVMELLSKIVFKVFIFEEMGGKSYISYS